MRHSTAQSKNAFNIYTHNKSQPVSAGSCFFALLSQIQFCNNGSVTLYILLYQVVQQTATLTNHLQQTATRMVVLRVNLQMLVQMIYASSQKRDLNLGRACVAFVACELLNDFALLLPTYCYCLLSLNNIPY